MTKDLLSVFETRTHEEWLNKITSDLKGKPLESLHWKSEMGAINPVLFHSEEITSDNFQQQEDNSWKIRQRFDANAKSVNEEILLALKGGVNCIEISNLSSKNITDVFYEVMLDIIHVYIDINTDDPKSIIDTFYQYCTSENISTKKLKGGFIYDPIGHVALSGNWLEDEKKSSGFKVSIYVFLCLFLKRTVKPARRRERWLLIFFNTTGRTVLQKYY